MRLESSSFFLFGGEFGLLVLRKVMILNRLGLTFAGHQLGYAGSCVCSILSCLTNVILINGHTRIEVIPQRFVCHDLSLDSIKFVRFNAIKQVADFRLWINPVLPCLIKPSITEY